MTLYERALRRAEQDNPGASDEEIKRSAKHYFTAHFKLRNNIETIKRVNGKLVLIHNREKFVPRDESEYRGVIKPCAAGDKLQAAIERDLRVPGSNSLPVYSSVYRGMSTHKTGFKNSSEAINYLRGFGFTGKIIIIK